MKTIKAAPKIETAEGIANGSCPVCSALKEFQSALIETVQMQGATHLCNYHAWALARSAPAAVAGEGFLNVLPLWRQHTATGGSGCDFCQRIRKEEQSRLKELAEQFGKPAIAELMREHGAICLAHGRGLASQLPPSLQSVLARVLSRTARDLDEELHAFVKNAQEGQHIGGGILGHVTEFLVSQRGISHEEAPCSNRDQQKR